jgi:hypothetical protein
LLAGGGSRDRHAAGVYKFAAAIFGLTHQKFYVYGNA